MLRSIVFFCASFCAISLYAQTPSLPCEDLQEGPCSASAVQEPSEEPPALGLSLPKEEQKHSTGTFSLGAGFSSEEGFLATAKVAQQNLFGTGYQLSLDASLSAKRSQGFVRFRAPHLGEKDGTLSIDIGASQYLYPNNIEKQWAGGRIGWERALADNWTMSLSGTLADTTLSTTQEFFPRNLLGSGLSAMGSLRLTYHASDDPKSPRNTFVQSLQADVSKSLVSDASFFRVEKDVSYSFAFGKGERAKSGPILRFGAKLGYMTSMNPDAELSIADRFFVGGEDSVRGFAPGVLGPQLKVLGGPDQQITAISIGGKGEAVFRSELEFPLLSKAGLRGLVFFDAGNTFGGIRGKDRGLFLPAQKDFGVLPLRTAAGIGLRWDSPIGPLNFSLGVPLDRRPGEAPILFTFSLGKSF
jgi:outer membrane protein insertion porin family